MVHEDELSSSLIDGFQKDVSTVMELNDTNRDGVPLSVLGPASSNFDATPAAITAEKMYDGDVVFEEVGDSEVVATAVHTMSHSKWTLLYSRGVKMKFNGNGGI